MTHEVTLSLEVAPNSAAGMPDGAVATHERPDYACNTSVERIAQGSGEALAQLYDESKSLVYGLALRILGNPEDAEEVALDVYKQVWRSAQSFDPVRGSATAWLVMLTRSRAIDRFRSRVSLRQEDPINERLELSTGAMNPEESSRQGQQRRRVQAAMEKLTRAEHEAIELAFFFGYTHSELAARLGQPLGTIKTRIRVALRKLRTELTPAFEA